MDKYVEVKKEAFVKLYESMKAGIPHQIDLYWGYNGNLSSFGSSPVFYSFQLYDIIENFQIDDDIEGRVIFEEPNSRVGKYLSKLDDIAKISASINDDENTFILKDIWCEIDDDSDDLDFTGVPNSKIFLFKYSSEDSQVSAAAES